MKSRNIQIKPDAVPAGKNGFAGREALAELFIRRAKDHEEIAAEFSALSGSGGPVSLEGGSRSIERALKRVLGVPVTVVELPAPSMSQGELDRLSDELKKTEQADPVSPPGRRASIDPVRLGGEIAEEFASLSASADIPFSSVNTGKAEKDISEISGIQMTVRPYPASKKKNLQEIDRE